MHNVTHQKKCFESILTVFETVNTEKTTHSHLSDEHATDILVLPVAPIQAIKATAGAGIGEGRGHVRCVRIGISWTLKSTQFEKKNVHKYIHT